MPIETISRAEGVSVIISLGEGDVRVATGVYVNKAIAPPVPINNVLFVEFSLSEKTIAPASIPVNEPNLVLQFPTINSLNDFIGNLSKFSNQFRMAASCNNETLTGEDLTLMDQALFAYPEYKQQGHDIMLARMGSITTKCSKKSLQEVKASSKQTMTELRQKVSALRSKILRQKDNTGEGHKFLFQCSSDPDVKPAQTTEV